MFSKFEFIADLVETGEVVFTYEDKKAKVIKKELFDDVDFGNKPNPLLAKKQYKTKYGYKDKTYGAKSTIKSPNEVEYEFKKKTYGSGREEGTYTPAYKRDKFK